MTLSEELAETARNGVRDILEEHDLATRASERSTRRLMVWFAFAFVLTTVSGVLLTSILQARLEARISQPNPPVVQVSNVLLDLDAVYCPGETMSYSSTLSIEQTTLSEIDMTVKNLTNGRTELFSKPVRTVYEPGIVSAVSRWTIPLQLGGTLNQPVRDWQPGPYRRVVSIVGVEGMYQASISHIDFQIDEGCP